LSEPGDRFELDFEGYVIDIERNGLLMEIQTRNFSAIKHKLSVLTERHKVRLIYPIATEKWIVKLAEDGKTVINRRKSPKHGDVYGLFDELVAFPQLINNPNFTLMTILIHEEELRVHRKGTNWRRKGWGTFERRLLDIKDTVVFKTHASFSRVIPDSLPKKFTTADLSTTLNKPRSLCQKMAYCLRIMKVIKQIDRDKTGVIYVRT